MQDEAGDGGHLNPDITRPVLSASAVKVDPLPEEPVRYRANIRKAGGVERLPILRLAEDRHVAGQADSQHLGCGVIEVVRVGV